MYAKRMEIVKINRQEAFSLPVNNKQGNCSAKIAKTTEMEEMKEGDAREMFLFSSRAFADFHFKFLVFS